MEPTPSDLNQPSPVPPAHPPDSAAGGASTATAPAAEETLESLRRELEELRERNLRLLAESRNLQQRAQRDKAQALKYAEADFARSLLLVLDDLERTLESIQAGADVPAISEGVRIVYEHFLKILKDRHIEPIEAAGRVFDPELHEALYQQPSEEHAAGIVLREAARGYKMHDRVIRTAKVVVSSG